MLLGLVGAGFLLKLMWSAILAFRSAMVPSGPSVQNRDDLRAGIVVSIANPAGLPFWTGLAGGAIVTGGSGHADGTRAILFLSGVLAGSLIWGCSLSALVGWGRRLLSPRLFQAINALCATAFGYFAVTMLASTVRIIAK